MRLTSSRDLTRCWLRPVRCQLEGDKATNGQMLGERGRAIKVRDSFERRLDGPARTKIGYEAPCRLFEADDLNASRMAVHEQIDRPGIDIKIGQGFVAAGQDCMPNVIDWIVRAQQAN